VKPARWPFRPEHITNDGEKYPEDSELNKLYGVGIISNEYLKGILFTIANKLKSPIMAMEFSPEKDEVPESTDNVVRTEAISIHFDFHQPCRAFKKYNRGLLCDMVEKKLAKLFRNLTQTELNIELLRQRAHKDASLKEYLDDTEVSFFLKETMGHRYLEFDCPLLAYSNLAFPIFFEERIVAVIYVGEIILKRKLDFINRKHEEFFVNHPHCFDEYCKKNKKTTPESCRREILTLHNRYVQNIKNIYTKEAYEKLVNKSAKEIGKLEATLSREKTRQRERYVVERTKNYNRAFYDGLPEKTLLGDEGIIILWRLVEKILKDICRDFSFSHIFLFGVNHYTKEYPSKLDIVAEAGELPSSLKAKKKKCTFDLTKIPEKARNEVTTSTRMLQLFDGLPFYLDKTNNFIRTSPVAFSPYSMIVTWAGYEDEIWNTSTIDAESGRALESSMRSFISIIASTFSGILVATTRDYLENTLRIFGHETGQLTSGLDSLRESYLSDFERLKNLKEKKANDILRDLDGFLEQLNYLFKQADMLISEPELKKTDFLAFGELLFKWRDIYRLESIKKSILIKIPNVDSKDPYRPAIYGDRILLEQLIYNIIGNAIKYCHRGTVIYMDCKKLDIKPNSPHILTITNYGIKMEKGENPYKLYNRGSNIYKGEGLGIGLYIAKQIVYAHDGSIDHDCEQISGFNVPLIKPYLERKLIGKKMHLIQPLREEDERLEKSAEYDKIIAIPKYEDLPLYYPSYLEIINSINKPSYKVTFTVIIPAKEGKK